MADEPTKERDLTDEELEAENGEQLPDRETMMIVDLGPDSGLPPVPPPDDAPDDRYEQ